MLHWPRTVIGLHSLTADARYPRNGFTQRGFQLCKTGPVSFGNNREKDEMDTVNLNPSTMRSENEAPAANPSKHRRAFKAEGLIFVTLALLIVALWIPRLRGPIDLRFDGGVYYVLGTSLAEGKGYRLLNEPGEILGNQYPPLFPLIIAAYQTVLGTSDPVVVGRFLRISSFLAFSVYIFAIYALFRRYLPAGISMFGTIVCSLNVHTYFMSDLCFPDLLQALFTVGFFLAASNANRFFNSRSAGVFAVAAFAVRTAGVGLLAVWVSEPLLKKKWRTTIARTAFVAVPIIAWFSYVHHVETSAEYERPAYAYQRADYMFYNVSYARNVSLNDPSNPDLGYATFSDRVERYLRNILRVTRYVGESVSSAKGFWEMEREEIAKRSAIQIGPRWIVDVPLFVLGFLVLAGTGILAKRGELQIALCILSSIFLLCLTPWPEQFNRYLVPTVPLLSLSLCVAIVWTLERSKEASGGAGKRLGRGLVYAVIIGIALQQMWTAGIVYLTRHLPVRYQTRNGDTIAYRLLFYMDSYRALDSGVDWLMAHARPTDVIAVDMPHWVYLRTGNKTVMPPFESDPVKAEQLLESVPVTYLVVDEGLPINSKRFTKGVVERFPNRWKAVYRDDVVNETGVRHKEAFVIYERIRAAGEVAP